VLKQNEHPNETRCIESDKISVNLDFNFIDVQESLLCSIEAVNYNSATFFDISWKI